MNTDVKKVIEQTLARARNELSGVRLNELTPDQNFFGGEAAALDSLNLVSFIFILEDEIKSVTGKSFKVSTNDILNKEEAPFKNLRSMEMWLTRKLESAK